MRTKPATPELAEIRRLHQVIADIRNRLESGRHYLMSVNEDKITVQDTLVAFGWTEEGRDRDY